jgi:UDP-4-amino-4,6-dideoxy-N-acetyl-beta-L-altrosamine transaminase
VIPYGRQLIEDDDIAAVTAALTSDFLTQGPRIAAFERELADYVGARHCVAVSSATAGLHIAVAALGIEPGSEAITSPNTFVATSNAALYCGLEPVFADIDPHSYLITPETVREKVSARTRLIMPVHFAGHPCDMEGLAELAQAHGARIIEDAAHAIGSSYEGGGRVGNGRLAAACVFSFHPVKTLTTGEGGAVTTNDDGIYEALLALRSHGITRDVARFVGGGEPGPWRYEMQTLGFNYRMTDVQAALGSSQLAKLERFAARRRQIIARYHQGLSGISGLGLPPVCEHACHHLFTVRIDFAALGLTRTGVMEALKARGVGTQVHYIPVHTQPYYTARGAVSLPQAESYYDQCLSLPLYPAMSDADVEQVMDAVREVLGHGRQH